ncbi:MAG: undecaprenyl/decaprenyl-phosphate alpha-N-acetylglucosaminyl 1-phosphate transferase [Planctomycetales bacterium]|nr:undecaprenyl/decaprenyl-phosphate alpha-N-acetylglucosaminyl 1-phosphate transferase [Planctomycetales bacterium]
MWLVLGAVLPSLLISWLAGFAVRRWAPRFGLVDHPGHRKVHKTPTPMGGGIAVWLAVVLPLAFGQLALFVIDSASAPPTSNEPSFFQPLYEIVRSHAAGLMTQAPRLWFLVGAATVLMVVGLRDDFRHIRWQIRLGIQTLVATAVVLAGWRLSVFVDAPWLLTAVSVVWIVGLINSFNMLDNMDGLTAGVGTISASILAAVMLLAPDPESNQPQLFVGGFLLVLVGGLLGFLLHNRPPARLFLGDAGSYFVGFWIAVATIMATFAGGDTPPHAVLAPLCVLSVPIYDTLTVVSIRLREGRSPFEADKNHFSHRLVELGLTKPQAVLTIYLMTATTGLGALLLYQVDTVGALVILTLNVCVLALVGILETAGRRRGK